MKALQQFVFGYGSLMCPHSRCLTAPEQAYKVATPVLARGVERWWAQRTARGMTAMGVRLTESSTTTSLASSSSSSAAAGCVGVLLPVTEQELRQFDQRERGYDRVWLPLHQIEAVPFLNTRQHYREPDHEVFFQAKQQQKQQRRIAAADAGPQSDPVQVWVYVPRDPLPPSSDYPICQSYLDTILRGCSTYGEPFGRAFLASTHGWSSQEWDRFKHSDNVDDDDDASSSTASTFSLSDGDSRSIMTAAAWDEPLSLASRDDLEEDDDDDSVVWVNDREQPIYPRGDPEYSRRQGPEFDRLLRQVRPQPFQRRLPLMDWLSSSSASSSGQGSASRRSSGGSSSSTSSRASQ